MLARVDSFLVELRVDVDKERTADDLFDEIGSCSRSGHRPYPSDEPPSGLHALFARVQPTAWGRRPSA
jgi:hypothetical protein